MIVVFKSDLELVLHSPIRLTDHFQRFNICSRCLRWTWRLDARAPFRNFVPKFQSRSLRDFYLRTCCFSLCGQRVIPVAFLYKCMHIQILQFKHIVLGHVWSAFDVHMPLRTKRMWLMSVWSPFLQQTDLFQVQKKRIQPGTTTVCTAPAVKETFQLNQKETDMVLTSGLSLGTPRWKHICIHPGVRSWTWDSSSTPWAHMAMAFVPFTKRHLRIYGCFQK